MKIYLAGTGHKIENTCFIKIYKNFSFLLSYYYLAYQIDKDIISRFKWIMNSKSKGEIKWQDEHDKYQ